VPHLAEQADLRFAELLAAVAERRLQHGPGSAGELGDATQPREKLPLLRLIDLLGADRFSGCAVEELRLAGRPQVTGPLGIPEHGDHVPLAVEHRDADWYLVDAAGLAAADPEDPQQVRAPAARAAPHHEPHDRVHVPVVKGQTGTGRRPGHGRHCPAPWPAAATPAPVWASARAITWRSGERPPASSQ
jgi:hypothetical protein